MRVPAIYLRMKTSLGHLPLRKREALARLKGLILEKAPSTEMIILFGSHARGDWVEDEYMEDGTVYEYKSDFDILVVTADKRTANDESLWGGIESAFIPPPLSSRTSVEIISHHIQDVNEKLEKGWYFFSDVKKEGVLLYDSGRCKLARRRKLDFAEIREKAQDDFDCWFGNAKEFFDNFKYKLAKKSYKIAAFELHQATEHAYNAMLLVFTGYKPRSHNIDALGRRASRYELELKTVFPRKTEEQRRLFKLLKKAYVDARYTKSYRITKEELEYLASRVRRLHAIAERVCRGKIASFAEEGASRKVIHPLARGRRRPSPSRRTVRESRR